MHKTFEFLTNAFPLWIILGSTIALLEPMVFTWFSGSFITYGLGVIMLGMGLTLKPEDFKIVIKSPKWILTGSLLQFTVMPLLGWGLGYIFHLPLPFAVGLIIVSCCPGGTASNVISYLAKANVALSVTMTAISTSLAIILTPLLTTFLIGDKIEVSAFQLFLGVVKVVLAPVLLGVLMNKYLPKFTNKILPVAPLIAVIAIVLIVASIIGQGKDEILSSGFRLIGAVLILHVLGFLMGYMISRFVIKEKQVNRTISIEVGMQNSGLGAYPARANFANPAIAIPSAISSAVHSLIGSLAAGIWRNRK
ncbi:MAG: bile acid:sodium symporter family protein [Cyclobacteriaceae bacterium]|nr:bile acid:sodium symporter family protein [Cyclobacteriaceae bacterium]